MIQPKPAMPAPTAAPRLTAVAVRKRFGATVALAGVDLSVAAGEVHALLGENGAGKSTLMKILSGAIRPDDGHIRLDNAVFRPGDPVRARAAGVAIVYQELNLAPHLTVEQNMVLGAERSIAGIIRRSRHRERVVQALARLNCPHIRPSQRVAELSPAGRQLVEIARALMTDARVLILDEPTSSLGLADIEHLFGVVRRLAAEGVAIIYISHFLEEVQRIADAWTVLRDGRTVGTGRMAGADMKAIVELMIGRELREMFPRVPHAAGPPVLDLRGLTGRRLPRDVDLRLHRGEILGIAGLVGAGRTELLRAIFALDPVRRGDITINGYSGCKHNPHDRLARRVGMLSEDRPREGLALGRSVADNLTLSGLARYARAGWINLKATHLSTTAWIHRLGIRARESRQRVGDLSGGNQQKVAIARLLHDDADVLLLDEPTRGIDVASKAQIYGLIGELAARGKAILMVSSYTPELLGICDRIAVMHRGRLSAARPAAEWTEHSIMTAATAGKEQAA